MGEQTFLFPCLTESNAACDKTPPPAGTPRVLMAERNQIALRAVDLEGTVGPEHSVRDVWAFVAETGFVGAVYRDRLDRRSGGSGSY